MAQEAAGIDRDALVERLEPALGPADEVAISEKGGGNANDTLFLRWDDERYVLRAPPDRAVLPRLLHDVRREHRVLSALQDTPVAVPATHGFYEADEVGRPCYVMEHVEGLEVNVAEPDVFAEPDRRERVGRAILDQLAAIHAVDVDARGLGDLGAVPAATCDAADASDVPDASDASDASDALDDPNALDIPDEPVKAMLDALGDVLDWATERTAEQRAVPALHATRDWLEDRPASSGHRTLIHGDYKPDNLVFDTELPPRLVGVFDWEMCGVGDPLTDLGWLLSYWHEPRDPSPLTDGIQERYEDHEQYHMLDLFVNHYARFMEEDGYPNRRELVERYEDATGFALERQRFYRALGVYKLAAICEGFYRFALEHPEDAKDTYPVMELMVPVLAEASRQIREGEVPL